MVSSTADIRARQRGVPCPTQPRKRLAIVTTVWRYLSHAQHMGDRFLVGYPWEGRWHRPAIDVVALYVDQKPDDDQSARASPRVWLQGLPDDTGGASVRRQRTGRRRRLDHRRTRRLSARTTRARFCIRGMSSSARQRGSSSKTAAPSRSSTTSTCRSASPRPGRWSRSLAAAQVPLSGRLVAAGHLAAAPDRAAPRLRDRRGTRGRRRQL